MTTQPVGPVGGVDLTNIGVRERKVRNVLGYVLLAVAIALAISLLAGDASRWLRLLLVIPAYQGLRFLYDARTGVCPLKAALGQEHRAGILTGMGQVISDASRVDGIRRISRKAMVRSAFGAILFTVIIMIVP